MKVGDCMTRDVHLVNPETTIREAARIMATTDTGCLPVGENDRLIGMVTDRDIAVRGVAEGCAPETRVRQVMTEDLKYCFEDEDIEHVARTMADIQVRRLPVMNRSKRLVGIIALCDLADSTKATVVGEALDGISRPGGEHCQSETRSH